MPTTEEKPKAAKSLIPKRIRSRIEAAFDAQALYAHSGKTIEEISKSNKAVARSKQDVLDFIEGLMKQLAG